MGLRERLDLGKKIVSITAREIGANIRAINLYPFGMMTRRQTGAPHPHFAVNKRPILLVHGVIHNASAFFPLRKCMEQEGWKNVFTINYPTRHGSLTKMVDTLSERVDEILAQTKSDQIDIVGHSLGGIISRYYMSVGAGRGKVHHLITLGTPHRGTPLSIFLKAGFMGGLNTDLRSGSYIIRMLNETALSRGSRLTSISSKYDFVAWPGGNCTVEGMPRHAFRNIELESIGHLGLLYSQESFAATMGALVDESPIESTHLVQKISES